jgi:AMP-binding enzyme C-terminal domain
MKTAGPPSCACCESRRRSRGLFRTHISPQKDRGCLAELHSVGGCVPRQGYHVVLKKDSTPVTERQLVEFAATHLPEHKVPQRIIFAESLPYGPTGKIDRKALRENASRSR